MDEVGVLGEEDQDNTLNPRAEMSSLLGVELPIVQHSLAAESQEDYSSDIEEIANLLGIEYPIVEILALIEVGSQRELDYLLVEVAKLKINTTSKISREKQLELLESLIDKGANVNAGGMYSGRTETYSVILEGFLQKGNIEAIKLLLSRGANIEVDIIANYSFMPFYAKMRLLMDCGVDLNISDNEGNILHRILDIKQMKAVYFDINKNHIEFLLENVVDPNVTDSNGFYPLDLAISEGNKDVEILLKKYGAKQSNQRFSVDPGFLLYAEAYGKPAGEYYSLQDIILIVNPHKYSGILAYQVYKIAELLLKAGAVITEDMPIISYASSFKSLDLVQLYLDHGANPNSVTEKGYSGLMIAVLNRDIPIINLLLKDGRVDLNATSIRFAEDEDEEDVILNVLDRALIPEFWDSSIKADFELAKLLINHGAKIGQRSFEWYRIEDLAELVELQEDYRK